jgi:hypothetical protein
MNPAVKNRLNIVFSNRRCMYQPMAITNLRAARRIRSTVLKLPRSKSLWM